MRKTITVEGMLLLVSFFIAIEVGAQNIQDTSHSNNSGISLDARVDPASLGLNLVIQLGDYPQRQGNLPVILRYSSKVWNISFINSRWDSSQSRNLTYTEPVFSGGWSTSLDPPSLGNVPSEAFDDYGNRVDLENPHNFNNGDSYFITPHFYITSADGVSHEFRKGDWIYERFYGYPINTNIWSGNFFSVDGSKMRFDTTNLTLYLNDGSRYVEDQIGGPFNTYIDPNGNVKRLVSGNWIDTLGRLIPRPSLVPPLTAQDVSYSLPGIGNGTLDFVFKWKKLEDVLTYSQPLRYPGNCIYFPQPFSPSLFQGSNSTEGGDVCSDDVVFNPVVINEIILPNGNSYKFTYDVYGEIDKIVYPTGGYERFQYGTFFGPSAASEPYGQADRGVTDRWVSSDGNALSETHWQYGSSYGGVNTLDPNGTKTERVYQPGTGGSNFGFGNSKTGKLIEEKVFDSNQNLLRRTLYQNDATGPVGTPPLTGIVISSANRDSRPIREVSVIFDPENTSALATMNEVFYDTTGNTDEAYFSSLNVKQTKKYNYVIVNALTATSANIATASGWFSSSNLAATSEMDYLYDANYMVRNITGLVTETRVKDAAGNIKAKSQIGYDESAYPIISAGTNAQWQDPNTTLRANVTTTRSWSDITNNLFVETHTQYDNFGNLRKVWDAKGNLTQTDYSATYQYAYPTRVTTPIPDPSGVNGSNTAFTATTVYDFNTALPTSATDANGQTTTIEYNDPLLRPTRTIAPNGAQTITEYGVGTSAATRFVKVSSQIDATNWKQAYSWFDGLGRTIKAQSVETTGDVFVNTEYDNMGRPYKSTNPYRANETKLWTQSTFDTAGRPWKVTTPDGAFVETTYSLATTGANIGTVVTVTDQALKQRRSVTNALGHLIRVDEPTDTGGLGAIDTPNQPTNYSYDTLNNLTTVNQGIQMRSFTYNSLSRLLNATNPESGTINYAYDPNGNLTSKTDARNVVTNYIYDALNRVTNRNYTAPTGLPNYQATPNVSYFYDGVNVAGGITNSKGKLTKVNSSVSTTEYTSFDILGRVTGHKQTTDGNAYTTGYTYKLSGALDEETYPSARVVKNVLDNNGNLSIVDSKKNANSGFFNYAKNFTYNAAGAATSLQLGNGKWESTQFNSRLQPTEIALGTVQNGTDKLKLDYTYNTLNTSDNNGNVKSQIITVPTVGSNAGFTAVQIYNYDSLNRLKDAAEAVSGSQTWKQTFTYDRYGNRNFDMANTTVPAPGCPVAVCNPTVNVANNRLNGYGFDSSGNTTTDANGLVFTYDAENKQVQVNNSQGTVGQYFYDGDGKRIKKYVPSTGETTIFVYDASGKSIAEYSTIVANSTDAKVDYLTSDHLGSPRINTDQNGAVIARHDYHPFGEEVFTSQRTVGLNYLGDTVRKQFTGYERDVESGLDFAQARMYANKLGRFTSPDPVVMGSVLEPAVWNKYSYCLSNPLSITDATGKWPPPIHDLIFLLAFPGLTRTEIESLQQGSRKVDLDGLEPKTIDPRNAPQHAMRSDFFPTLEAAQNEENRFIANETRDAKALGDTDDGLRCVGAACHPRQDGTSPEHRPFQYFHTPSMLLQSLSLLGAALKFGIDMEEHKRKESVIKYTQLEEAIDLTRQTYKNALPNSYDRAVPSFWRNATFYFNGPITGLNGQFPSHVDFGLLAIVDVSGNGEKKTRKKFFPNFLE